MLLGVLTLMTRGITCSWVELHSKAHMRCRNQDAVSSNLFRSPAITGQGCTYCAGTSGTGEGKHLGRSSSPFCSVLDNTGTALPKTRQGYRCWLQGADILLPTQSVICCLTERRYSLQGGPFSAESLGKNRFFLYIEVHLMEQLGRAEHAF